MTQHAVSSWGRLLGKREQPEQPYSSRHDRRKWKRYPCDVAVHCQELHNAASTPTLAHVRDISRGGLRLVAGLRLEPGTVLSVQTDELASGWGALACVLHSTAQPDGTWAMGCMFVIELDDTDLVPFGALSVPTDTLDRRHFKRFTCQLQATYRPVGLAERKAKQAVVLDLSARGIGLQLERRFEVGTVLCLDLQGEGAKPLRLLACVVRLNGMRDGQWLLGCNFIREISELELRAFV